MFKTAIVIGRFQVFHLGHKEIIDNALRMCTKVIVFVGSSQESGTERNPLSFEERKECIEDVYPTSVKYGRLTILPLPDAGLGNGGEWGKYVLSQIPQTFEKPYLIVSGKEERRINWFANENISELTIAKLNRPEEDVLLSASALRQFMINNNEEKWKSATPPEIHHRYNQIRSKIVASTGNTNTKSI